jgi:fructoselysine-6-P-deglycase FrlB-like protein
MILADKVGRMKPEQAALILKEHFWIPCSSVFAGEVQHGKVEDIMNRELEMIAIERLDAVSTEINDEFDQLFQLEDIPLDPDLAAYLEENAQ